jgi:hypothetical protein
VFGVNCIPRPNIERRGRIGRGVVGVLCLVAGVVIAVEYSVWLALVFLAAGVFALFEAACGWCAMRACGVKTKY